MRSINGNLYILGRVGENFFQNRTAFCCEIKKIRFEVKHASWTFCWGLGHGISILLNKLTYIDKTDRRSGGRENCVCLFSHNAVRRRPYDRTHSSRNLLKMTEHMVQRPEATLVSWSMRIAAAIFDLGSKCVNRRWNSVLGTPATHARLANYPCPATLLLHPELITALFELDGHRWWLGGSVTQWPSDRLAHKTNFLSPAPSEPKIRIYLTTFKKKLNQTFFFFFWIPIKMLIKTRRALSIFQLPT